MLKLIDPTTILVPCCDILKFNLQYPGSKLSPEYCAWFQFDHLGNLIDCSVPNEQDGPWSSALAEDCKGFLFNHLIPKWLCEANIK